MGKSGIRYTAKIKSPTPAKVRAAAAAVKADAARRGLRVAQAAVKKGK